MCSNTPALSVIGLGESPARDSLKVDSLPEIPLADSLSPGLGCFRK